MVEPLRILLTGFPPFPGCPVNPTQQLVEAVRLGEVRLPDKCEVRPEVVPCAYREVEEVFTGLIDEFQPHVVLSFGVGHRDNLLHLECQGINLDDSAVVDNAGECRQGGEIIPGGKFVLPATLDLQQLSRHLESVGVNHVLSDSAGRYLCNHLLYFGLHLARKQTVPYQMTFIHVRPLDACGGTTAIVFQEFAAAVEHLIEGVVGQCRWGG
ncbi:MAG: hypothetical protein KDA58_10500 [Planctomycetaceae bacterium]|nr:hypothetical protein [Planctomycetaceae bacterium]